MFKTALIALLAVAAVSAVPAKKQLVYKSPMPRMPIKEGMSAPTRPDGKIVGGELASQGQFPYQAAVSIDGLYFCGGTLIEADWVLCAAHCTTGSANIEVTMGELDRRDNSGTEQVSTSSGSDIHTHEDYNAVLIRNDVSLIKVTPSFELNDNVATIAIATDATTQATVGEEVILSGWGKTSDGAISAASELHFVQVPITDYEDCSGYYGLGSVERQICLDTTGGHGVCNGDSGGPMVPTDQSVVYGVASYVSSAGCASGYPHVFTRVSYFADWIMNTMSA